MGILCAIQIDKVSVFGEIIVFQCRCPVWMCTINHISGKNKMPLISLRWSIFSNHAVMPNWEEMAIFVKHQYGAGFDK